MKKVRIAALITASVFTLVACGSDKQPSTENTNVPTNEAAEHHTTEVNGDDLSTGDSLDNSPEAANPEDFSYIELEDGTFAIRSYKGNASVVVVPEEIDGKKITSVDGINNKDFITKIILPDTVTVIEDDAFSDNMNLEEVVLGKNVVKIGKRSFGLDTKLTSITLPDTVTEIGPKAFYVSGIIEINIPSGVSIIEDSTFAGSTLESITIPGTVKTISANAFEDSELKEVVIEEGVETIEDSAFSGCKNLTSIEIPASVTSILTDLEKNCTIVAPAGSYAETYANENGYNFKVK